MKCLAFHFSTHVYKVRVVTLAHLRHTSPGGTPAPEPDCSSRELRPIFFTYRMQCTAKLIMKMISYHSFNVYICWLGHTHKYLKAFLYFLTLTLKAKAHYHSCWLSPFICFNKIFRFLRVWKMHSFIVLAFGWVYSFSFIRGYTVVIPETPAWLQAGSSPTLCGWTTDAHKTDQWHAMHTHTLCTGVYNIQSSLFL